MRELHARVELLGGRRYPIRLDYFKYKEKFASIKLEWKPPHGTWSLLDREHLSPEPASRTMVVTTPFPADDRSYGYERGTTISKEWHEATTKAAVEVANEVLDRIDNFVGREDAGAGIAAGRAEDDSEACRKSRALLRGVCPTAFRRPLSDAERKLFVDSQFDRHRQPRHRIKRCILLTLKSPRFLYTEIPDGMPTSPTPTPSPRASPSRCGIRSQTGPCSSPPSRTSCRPPSRSRVRRAG